MSDPLQFGKIPHPSFEDRPITKPQGFGQNDLGQRTVQGVVLHRMLGTLRGTDGYFRQDDVTALTDYGVGVAGPDAAGDNGAIFRWNDPLGRQSGWASGPVAGAYGDGAAFLDDHGWDLNAVNRDQASVEISGDYGTPLTEPARNAIAGLMAYWADQSRIPWDAFPIIPGKGYSFIRWHQEYCIGTGKVCPGEVVIAETPALIERARAIMRAAQTGDTEPLPKPPVYAAPQLPAWWARALARPWPSDTDVDGTMWRVCRRNVEALAPTRRLAAPDPTAKKAGPDVKTREKVTIERQLQITTPDGKRRTWFVETSGAFLLASKFTPRIRIEAR